MVFVIVFFLVVMNVRIEVDLRAPDRCRAGGWGMLVFPYRASVQRSISNMKRTFASIGPGSWNCLWGEGKGEGYMLFRRIMDTRK